MEMNTRIQVEHPVTEMVTGLDLIELQIRIAQGEELPLKQEDVKLKGWAIEYRINAEDVQSNFAPNLGIIEKMVLPEGENVRIDTGVVDGAVISPNFDSMIIKLIVYGEDRKTCISNSLKALRELKIKGLKTTIPFCKAVLHNKAFIKGKFNTSFIEKELKELFYQEPSEEMLAAFFATIDYLTEIKQSEEVTVDYDRGKNLNPWLLNKRSKSL